MTSILLERFSEVLTIIEDNEKTYYILGTAHISSTSVEQTESLIRELTPDSVAIELCSARYESLKDPDRWKKTDIVKVIKEGKTYVLLAQLILAGFQKKLGAKLDIKPGSEMLKAASVAEELNLPITLADRDVKITLKRIWSNLGLWSIAKLLFASMAGLFSKETVSEEEIERLRTSDALEEMMKEFTQALPDVRKSLIDERDIYLAQKIKNSPGKSVVAIVGAGHVPGIKQYIKDEINIEELDVIPEPSIVSKSLGWVIPISIILLIVYGFFTAGADASIDMAIAWSLATGLMGGLGALVVLAHPLTILASIIACPFTALNPFIAGGWVAGLVEAMLRKPTVADLETIADDVSTLSGILRNRLSRILLIVCSVNIFASIGTLIGIERIIHYLRVG